MKVLHLVAGELSGGAARGAYWLHRAQLEIGVDSTLITNGRDNLGDASVIALGHTRASRALSAIRAELGRLPIYLYPERDNRTFSTGFTGFDFTRHLAYTEADLVHLHWINGLVAMRTLRKVRKPTVWTMRDMWPLTGGCHYAMNCERYRVGCGHCPQLGSARLNDLSRFVVTNKAASIPKSLQLVGISQWLSDCALNSRVLSGNPVSTIFNGIDTREFAPVDANNARRILGIPLASRVVLAGAQQISDYYKGFDLLIEALNSLHDRAIHLVLFGRVRDRDVQKLGVDFTSLGFLSDTVSLRLAYAAADVFVAPSRMEAFGKTLAEAMACGTPVVCFDATGTSNLVEHEATGFKAKPFEPAELTRGIQWVLGLSDEDHRLMREKARARAVSLFDSRVIAQQYLHLYARMLGETELRS